MCEFMVIIIKLLGCVLAATHFYSLSRSREQDDVFAIIFHSVMGTVYLGCVLAILLAESGLFSMPI